MKRILIVGSLLFAFGAQAAETEFKGYDVLSRYKQLEDKFKTHEMLTPYGHDFILNVNAYLNKNLFDLIDDVKEVSDAEGTTLEQISAAQETLEDYENTEQSLRVNVLVGIPLFSFKAWGVKFVPDLRVGANMGAQIGIKSDIFDIDDILEFIPDDVPDPVKDLIAENVTDIEVELDASEDRDIAQALIDTGNLTAEEELLVAEYVGKYNMPELNIKQPILHMYTKLDIQGGIDLNMFKNRWFGTFSLYGLHRTDYLKRVSAQKLINDDGLFDDADNLNSTLYLTTDYKFGYKTKRYSMWTAIEEVKLATLNDNEEEAGEVLYGTNPRFRLHGDALFKFGVVSAMPFAGLHYQTDYDLMDGAYVGADWGIHVWKSRIGIRMRTMLDNEHMTLAPKFKFGIGHIEYMLKLPFVGEKDGVEPSAIHAANLRLFF